MSQAATKKKKRLGREELTLNLKVQVGRSEQFRVHL